MQGICREGRQPCCRRRLLIPCKSTCSAAAAAGPVKSLRKEQQGNKWFSPKSLCRLSLSFSGNDPTFNFSNYFSNPFFLLQNYPTSPSPKKRKKTNPFWKFSPTIFPIFPFPPENSQKSHCHVVYSMRATLGALKGESTFSINNQTHSCTSPLQDIQNTKGNFYIFFWYRL